jgi:hypothetical protein
MSHTISSSDLKRQLGAWLDWIGRTREDLIIETYGRPVAAVLAYEEYADYLVYRQARDGEVARPNGRRAAPPLPPRSSSIGIAS